MNNIINFFDECNIKNIQYCLWKSTDQVQTSIVGKTDFDIYIKIEDFEQFKKILKKFNFFFTVAPKNKKYLKNEFDAFFLDEKLNLIHFHLYTSIIIADKTKKNLEFKLREEIFSSLISCDNTKIKLINPKIELFLLLTRFYFKLKKRTNNKKLLKELNDQYNFLKKRLSLRTLRVDLPLIENNLEYVNYEIVKHFFNSNRKKINNFFYKKNQKNKFTLFALKKRTLKENGIIIAFVGHDGSGKTTLVKNIFEILKKKILIKKFYLGKVKNINNILLRSIVNFFNKIYKLAIIHYYKRRGYLVVIDRYPQAEKNYNDGPIFKKNKYNYFYIIENKFYKFLTKYFVPDILFKIICDTEKIINRKPNLNVDLLDKKNSHIIEHSFNSKKIEFLNGMNNKSQNIRYIFTEIINYYGKN